MTDEELAQEAYEEWLQYNHIQEEKITQEEYFHEQYRLELIQEIPDIDLKRLTKGCSYCSLGIDLYEVEGRSKARIDAVARTLDVMDGYGEVFTTGVRFCPKCGKYLGERT